MNALLRNFWEDDSGQALAEYGLVLALVAISVIAAVTAFRQKIIAVFNDMASKLP